ncbi:MAG: hypothetical protein IKO16_00185 [Lachnospiraceae bacterium]|nr:hypothetical protein [Lachnospiraceae bacterium]
MSSLAAFINEYIAGLSGIYYVRQLIAAVLLFVFGALLTDLFVKDEVSWLKRSVLAFPSGISAFAITAYAMLVLRIPYNSISVTAVISAEAAGAALALAMSKRTGRVGKYRRHMIITAAAAIVIAAFAVSGITPVSISNDTMYYFKRYPDAIVYYGGLRDQFDFFLTDTGLGVVSLDTLPALFGFGDTFGIRECFHINFLLFFFATVQERAQKHLSLKDSYVFAAVVTATLATATPFVILGHWALANMYFMELFFIAAYTAMDHEADAAGAASVMLVALGLLRIEGTLFVIWLIVCVCAYTGAGKIMASHVVLPLGILFGLYCLNVFARFYVLDNMYLFLSPVKAVLIICMMIGAGIYLAFIQNRLPDNISRHLSLIYIGALLAGNIVLALYDGTHYFGNLAAFRDNLFRQSGWGMFPYLVIASSAFLIFECAVSCFTKANRKYPSGFAITLAAGFLLIVIAASFGRGDLLAEDVGDSGNRVLLQIVPLIVMALGEQFLYVLCYNHVDGETDGKRGD